MRCRTNPSSSFAIAVRSYQKSHQLHVEYHKSRVSSSCLIFRPVGSEWSRPGAQFSEYFFVLSCMAASVAQQVDSESFVFHVTLFLLAALGSIVLFRLPRGIALFGSDEWCIGHVLRYIPYRPTSRSRPIIPAAHTTCHPPHHHHILRKPIYTQ